MPHLKVLHIDQNEHDYSIKAEMASPPILCPHCFNRDFVGFGRKEQLFIDLPIHGKRVGILVKRRRYRCKVCGKTFLELLPDMDEKRLATTRLIKYVQKQSLKRTFASISEDVGLDEKTVRNIFRDYVTYLEKTVRFATPEYLGIDEIHIIHPRCVVCNVKDKTIINILQNRNKETVIKYLLELPDRDRIKYVSMDMWQPYRDAVKLVLPQAKIIVDKFYVLRMANHGVETVRKDIRANMTAKQRRTLMHDRFVLLKRRHELKEAEFLKLESWTKNLPDLGKTYELKEEFFLVYESKNQTEAIERYNAWLSKVTDEVYCAFEPLITAMTNWHQEVFNYFNHPITNAYTESLNGLIRVMNRLGRGYSFEALRAKILFTEGLPNSKRSLYRRQNRQPIMNRMVIAETPIDYQNWDTGIPITTLIEFIKKGKI